MRTEAEYAAIQARIDDLVDMPELSQAEEAYLNLLGDLVQVWEEENFPSFEPVSGMEMVRFLLDQHGLPASALSDIFGTRSVVSDVLSGKRQLQTKHIQALAERFNVSPALFFPFQQSASGSTRGT